MKLQLTDHLKPLLGRAGWTITDQGLSSLTNFGVNILIARSVGIDDYGAFVVAFATYTLALGVSRQLGSSPLLIRFTAAPSAERSQATSAAAGTGLAVGLTAGALMALVAVAVPGSVGASLLVLALALPGLLLQDTFRMALFAHGRARAAAGNDFFWALVQACSIILVLTLGTRSVEQFMAAWGFSASVAALLGAYQLRTFPGLRRGVRWAHSQRDLSLPLLGEFSLYTGSKQAAVYLVAGIGGVHVAGALGAALMMLGPLNVVFMGARLLAVPEGARVRRTSPDTLRRATVALSATLGSIACLWAGAIYLLPINAGEFILRSAWHDARPLIPFVGAVSVALGLAIGPSVALKVTEQAQHLLVVSALASPVNLGARAIGASVGGAAGAAIGHAAAAWIETGLLWHKYLNTHQRSPAQPGLGADDRQSLETSPRPELA